VLVRKNVSIAKNGENSGLSTSLNTNTGCRDAETAEILPVPPKDMSPLNPYEHQLRMWLSALTPFHKKVLAATLQTFDTPLTAICYTSSVAAAVPDGDPARSIQSVPRLLLLDVVTIADAVPNEEGHPPTGSQLFLAVAAADYATIQKVLASGDTCRALLPFTLELLDFTT
jgi:hypothetical protein